MRSLYSFFIHAYHTIFLMTYTIQIHYDISIIFKIKENFRGCSIFTVNLLYLSYTGWPTKKGPMMRPTKKGLPGDPKKRVRSVSHIHSISFKAVVQSAMYLTKMKGVSCVRPQASVVSGVCRQPIFSEILQVQNMVICINPNYQLSGSEKSVRSHRVRGFFVASFVTKSRHQLRSVSVLIPRTFLPIWAPVFDREYWLDKIRQSYCRIPT